MTDKRIVVVGAGFGGLRAALSLWRGLKRARLGERYQVMLLNRDDRHVYTPLLYKLATDPSFPLDRASYPLSQLLARTGIRFLASEVREMDLERGLLYLGNSDKIKADYLVLAPGSETNYFDIPGLKDYALPFKTLDDAVILRERLKNLHSSSRIVLGGGGPTGVELAGALGAAHDAKITVIEAMPTLLPGFAARLGELAARRLGKLDVNILTNSPIAAAQKDSVKLKGGKMVPYDLLIWTGGVKVPSWMPGLPLRAEKRGRLEVGGAMDCLSLAGSGATIASGLKVYAVGDVACVHDSRGNVLSGVAPAAIDQGEVAAYDILQDILKSEGRAHGETVSYRPAKYPYVLPIGRRYAIGTWRSLILRGAPAWILKELIEIDYRFSIMPIGKALRF